MREGRARTGAIVGVGFLGLVAAAGLTGVSASPTSLAQTSAKAVVNAPPDALWYGQMNATTVCAVLPGCVSATPISGGYTLSLRGQIDGLGQITQDVTAKIAKKKPTKLMRLRLSSQSGLGSLASTVDLRLARKGTKKTTITIDVKKASGAGALGAIMLPFLATRLQPGLIAYTEDLNQQLDYSNLRVKATTRHAKKHRVKVLVYQANPLMQAPATATGKVRVTTAKGKVLCKTKIVKSKGNCSYRKGPKKPRVVVTGQYSNGFQVWHATTARSAK